MFVVLSAIVMLVDLLVAIMQVTVSVAVMQLEVSVAFVMRCEIWYHLYNLKNVKKDHLVPFYKWYQIVQRITYVEDNFY